MERASLLVGCYPDRGLAEPRVFLTALASVLERYPEDIVRLVTSPSTGIAGKSRFLPSVAEVRDACEAAMAPIRRQQERERIAREQQRLLAAPVEPKPTLDELKAQHGETWGIDYKARKERPHVKTEAEMLTEASVTKIEVSDGLKAHNAEFIAHLRKAG